MDILLEVAAWVGTVLLSAFVSLLIAILFGDQISLVLARRLADLVPKPQRKIAGVWYSLFWYKGIDGVIVPKQNLVRIRAFASRFVADTVAGDDHRIRFSGGVRQDIYATGKWEHKSSENLYHGAFHFILDPEGDRLHGRWIGFNKKQVVSMGPWILLRVSRDLDEASIDSLRKRYSDEGLVRINLFPVEIRHRLAEIRSQQVERETVVSWNQSSLEV